MNNYILFQIFELLAVFTEGFIALFIPVKLTSEKPCNKKTYAYILSFCVLYTLIMTLIDQFMFSPFITIPFSVLLTFTATFAVSTENVSHKICASLITWFFMSALNCITACLVIICTSGFSDIQSGLSLISGIGNIRTFYLFISKLLQLFVVLALKKGFRDFIFLSKKSINLLSAVTGISYALMLLSTDLIAAKSLRTLRLTVVLLLSFIIVAVATAVITVSKDSKHRSRERESELSSLTSSFLEKNYNDINNSQEIIYKQVHDFKNHLKTVSGMLPETSPAKEYISELLEVSYQKAGRCNSGNDVIDSVINCKMTEAVSKGIRLTYKINLSSRLNIPMIDICAILSNQLDNALEANENADSTSLRSIDVEIFQKNSLIFFKVTNTVPENPFKYSETLSTTKENKSLTHGFGIKIIRDTVERHNGSLKMEFKDNRFVSVAMISNE